MGTISAVMQTIQKKREEREENGLLKLLRQETTLQVQLKDPRLNWKRGELQYKLAETREKIRSMERVASRMALREEERIRRQVVEAILNEG